MNVHRILYACINMHLFSRIYLHVHAYVVYDLLGRELHFGGLRE